VRGMERWWIAEAPFWTPTNGDALRFILSKNISFLTIVDSMDRDDL
jgi:hypothetical protein